MSRVEKQVIYDSSNSRVLIANVGKYPFHRYSVNSSGPQKLRLPIIADFAGDDEWVKGCYRKRFHSSVFSIEYVYRGNMEYSQDGQTYLIEPGDVFFVHKARESTMETGPAEFCRKLACSLSGELLDATLINLGLFDTDTIQLKAPLFLEHLILSVEKELKEKTAGYQQRSSSLAYKILLQLGSELEKQAYPQLLVTILDYFDKNVSKMLTVNDISSRYAISPSSLHRLFKQHLQIGPIEHFINLKMSSARQLLKNTSLPIKEIAFSVGYDNPLYFSTEFKKRSGVSPRQFRNQN